jgi:hypothetical protein
MSMKAGVWIDHHKAVVVRMKDGGEEIVQIDSNADMPFASAAGPGSNRPQGHVAENRQEHKFMNQLNTYYDEVLKVLHGADTLLILGPGEAKGEFQKRLQGKKFSAGVVEIETADKMTDGQIAARVRQYLAK